MNTLADYWYKSSASSSKWQSVVPQQIANIQNSNKNKKMCFSHEKNISVKKKGHKPLTQGHIPSQAKNP